MARFEIRVVERKRVVGHGRRSCGAQFKKRRRRAASGRLIGRGFMRVATASPLISVVSQRHLGKDGRPNSITAAGRARQGAVNLPPHGGSSALSISCARLGQKYNQAKLFM